jgi:hypothetical protein
MRPRSVVALVALLFFSGRLAWAQDSSQVLTAGDVRLRVTNHGYVGSLDTTQPAGQWPGASGIEYLRSIGLAVGAVDRQTADPARARRVSFFREWGPGIRDPVDRLYSSFEGAANGARFVNDDGDVDASQIDRPPRFDEDFLDGRDNDGDGLIDEDYAAVGTQMLSAVMRDDGPDASSGDPSEPHMPLGLECRQLAWAYSVPGFRNFCVVEYTIVNRSGHTLDSLTIGWRVDLDAGPQASAGRGLDDRDLPQVPSGEFVWALPTTDPRRQLPHDPALSSDVPPDSALCPRLKLRINGFSLADGTGGGCPSIPGIATFLLVAHRTDPLGFSAPARVGFRAYRSYLKGTPFGSGGEPANDLERFAFMVGHDNVDPTTGFITAGPGAQRGDYVSWCSVGPFPSVPDGGSVQATVAFAVAPGDFETESAYAADYTAFQNGQMTSGQLFARHAPLANALSIAAAYEGTHAVVNGFLDSKPAEEGGRDFHGRETGIKLPPGAPPQTVGEDCSSEGREPRYVIVSDRENSWFDFDCDYCTGVWDYPTHRGLVHETWNTTRPPIVPVPAPPDPSPPVAMSVSMQPRTLNLHSMGRWVTCLLEPAAPLTAEQIDVGSILLNGTVRVDPEAPTEVADHDGNGIEDVSVKFDRGDVELMLGEGDAVPVTVTGTIDGHCSLGSTSIRVLHAAVSEPAAGARVPVGGLTTVRWETPPGVVIESVALLESMDDGATWTLRARDLPNTGSMDWIAPGTVTDRARVAVVLVEHTEQGDEVEGVLGMSGAFSIVGVAGASTPRFEFALNAIAPNPARTLRVSFSLPDARPASVALLDVTGRRLITRDLGGVGPGRHSVTLGDEMAIPSGVYIVRLSQGGRSVSTRAVVMQ